MLPPLRPHPSRAHLEERQREGDARPTRTSRRPRQTTVGVRSLPAGRAPRPLHLHPFVGQPRLLGRHAPHRRDRLPVLQERRLGGAGAEQGRGRLRRGITTLKVKTAEEPVRASPRTRQLPGLQRDRVQHRRRVKTGKPIGNPNPRAQDPKFRHALGWALNLPQLIQKVCRGAGLPGTTFVPPVYTTYHWEPPADQKFTYDLAKARALLDAAGYKVGSDGLRTAAQRQPSRSGSTAAPTPRPRSRPSPTSRAGSRPRGREPGRPTAPDAS